MPSKKITKTFTNVKTRGKIPSAQQIAKAIQQLKEANNSFPANNQLSGLFGIDMGNTVPMSQPYTLSNSNNYVPITLDQILINYSYMTHGIFQTAIDQPVYDAFRGGLVINSPELDEKDIQLLQRYMRDNKIMHEITDAFRWTRLFGGAGIIINTPQDTKTSLNRNFMDYPDIPLSFVAADRWELCMNIVNINNVEYPYNYYGTPFTQDRVIRIVGKEAPSWIRPQLMGWGFSELERMIRDINAYVKANQVVFQLLDEAKIDVWKLVGFNDTVLSDLAAGKVNRRIQYGNYLKNYHNAIMMDAEDDFAQRTQTFSGLGEIIHQIRLGICASLRMPMSKVFGISAAGLSAGEDDLESYNALVESEIREPAIPICHQVVELSCRQLFGFEPELTIGFKPLRVLGAVQEEEVKTSKQNRYVQLRSIGQLTAQELAEICKKEELQIMDTAVLAGEDPDMPDTQEDDTITEDNPKKKKKD